MAARRERPWHHRLGTHLCRGDGLRVRQVCAQAPYLPLAQLPQRADRRLDGHFSPASKAAQAPQHQDGLAEIAKLVPEKLEPAPGRAQAIEVHPDSIVAPEHLALDGCEPHLPLQVIGGQLAEGPGVAPTERVYRPLYDLDVLVRQA